MIHGGDIYRNQVDLDFSINVNPLGIPEQVKKALRKAMDHCDRYPDIKAERLHQAIGQKYGIQPQHILCGNGASELFMAIVHAVQPRNIWIPIPSFFGYEYVAKAVNGTVTYYEMKEEDQFCLTVEALSQLHDKIDMVFLTNPNNPIGNLIEPFLLIQILNVCKEKEIIVVLDECFIEFIEDGESHSCKNQIMAYSNLIVVRAFTKIFAIPGVRLGYLFCENSLLFEAIQKQLPEWNLSVFAQEAGIQACLEVDYIQQTITLLDKERTYMQQRLTAFGMKVIPSLADFILFYSDLPLYEWLLEQSILIRDCSNFRGLKQGYYRIAIKAHEDNKRLMDTISELMDQRGNCNGTD